MDIDWSRIRPVPYDDDPPERAELAAEIDRLHRELAEAQRYTADEHAPETSSLLHAEMRRLTASIDAMKAALPPLLVPVDVAATALGISISSVRRGMKNGSIPFRHFGKAVRIDLSACKGLDGDDISRMARAARSGR